MSIKFLNMNHAPTKDLRREASGVILSYLVIFRRLCTS